MLRRDFLVVVVALATVGASSVEDPLAALPRSLRKRLLAFAKVMERNEWSVAVGYFDPENHAFQHKIFFSTEHNEDPLDAGDPEAQAAFLEWYLLGALGLSTPEQATDLDDVIAIRYRGSEEALGGVGPIRILVDFETRAGARTGGFLVDRDTLAFLGPEG